MLVCWSWTSWFSAARGLCGDFVSSLPFSVSSRSSVDTELERNTVAPPRSAHVLFNGCCCRRRRRVVGGLLEKTQHSANAVFVCIEKHLIASVISLNERTSCVISLIFPPLFRTRFSRRSNRESCERKHEIVCDLLRKLSAILLPLLSLTLFLLCVVFG